MSRWKRLFALALACWLPLQSALAWLPLPPPASLEAAFLDQGRTSSPLHDAVSPDVVARETSQAHDHHAMSGCGMADAQMATPQPPSHLSADSSVADSSLADSPVADCAASGCGSPQLPGMQLGHSHCGACVPVIGALLESVVPQDFGLRPSLERVAWVSPRYISFVPGIPSPPPCHWLV